MPKGVYNHYMFRGDKNPAKRPEVRAKLSANNCMHKAVYRKKVSEALTGRKCPWTVEVNKRPEIRATRGKHMKLPKYRELARKRMKSNPPMKNPETVKKQVKTKRRKFMSGELVAWNKGLTAKTDERVKRNVKNLCAKNKTKWQDKEFVIKWVNSIKRCPNNLELTFIKLFETLEYPLTYVGDGSFWIIANNKEKILKLNPDFRHDLEKKIILIHGVYWHLQRRRNNGECNITKNDVEKEDKEKYSKTGWECLIIWEDELKNPMDMIEKMEMFL